MPKDVIWKDGIMYCPHCKSQLNRVIVEVKGYAVIRVKDNETLGMTSFEDFEAEEYLSYECRDCGGELSE